MDENGSTQTGQAPWTNGHARLLRALAGHGNICRACRETGISRSLVYQWLDKNPSYAAAVEETRRSGLRGMRDAAVDHLYRAIESEVSELTPESVRVAIHVVKTLDADVFGERTRTELTGANGGALQVEGVIRTIVQAPHD